jgi:aldose 1-epimerase
MESEMNHVRIAAAAAGIAFAAAAHAEVHKQGWGTTKHGESVDLYTISSGPLTVTVTNYGAHVVTIEAPDKAGQKADVVLGFKDISGYEDPKNTAYIGAIVGRYGNRIASGVFSLEGKPYRVPANNNGNALHGGTTGFDQKVWQAHEIPNGVELTLISPDGDMGFPGALTAKVKYTVIGSSLHIDYTVTTDKPTVVNLTNHSYFNLAGEGSGTILDHRLAIEADKITPIDAGLIPTGKFLPVDGTPFDFRQAHAIGERINSADEQLKLAGGYDHNFVLTHNHTGLHLVAKAYDPKSGRTLEVRSTEPGVQFYSGNFLDGSLIGRSGAKYEKYAGFCLETQHFPDSPNQPSFPSTELKPGRVLHSSTIFTFGVSK